MGGHVNLDRAVGIGFIHPPFMAHVNPISSLIAAEGERVDEVGEGIMGEGKR